MCTDNGGVVVRNVARNFRYVVSWWVARLANGPARLTTEAVHEHRKNIAVGPNHSSRQHTRQHRRGGQRGRLHDGACSVQRLNPQRRGNPAANSAKHKQTQERKTNLTKGVTAAAW